MADISTELRETERRILGNLPAYRTPEGHEAAIAEALEHGTITDADQWPKSRTLADLTARLANDRHCLVGSGAEDLVEHVLNGLIDRGLVEQDDGEYAMTEAGLAALTA